MRILYMLTSLGIGGAEKQALSLAEHMAARGHSTLMVILREPEQDQWPTHLETVYLHLRKNPVSILRGLLHARRTLRAFRPDLVHSHTYPANLFARVLRLLRIAPPVVSTIHNVYEGGRWRMLAYRMTDGLTLHSTAVSREAVRCLMRTRAVSPGKCTMIANAIDTTEFLPNPAQRAATRAELGAGDDFLWLAVGRLVNAKGFLNLLQAFAEVWPVFPNTQLWIAGTGPRGASHRTEYSLLVARRGTMDRVRRLGLRRDMPALFDAADAFILSSAWEGMPLVVGEAMAMQKPVVATDVGGVRELLGECGKLVPMRNPERLGQAMLDIMRRPLDARLALGHQARTRIAANFGAPARFAQWESFYSGLQV
jgi:glycosyltransferase involved in cell wall biosynthesis